MDFGEGVGRVVGEDGGRAALAGGGRFGVVSDRATSQAMNFWNALGLKEARSDSTVSAPSCITSR